MVEDLDIQAQIRDLTRHMDDLRVHFEAMEDADKGKGDAPSERVAHNMDVGIQQMDASGVAPPPPLPVGTVAPRYPRLLHPAMSP